MTAKIRASYTKLALHHFKHHHAADYRTLCDRIGAPVLDRIRQSGPLSLLDAGLHAAVADATLVVFGAREARIAWRDIMLNAFDRALLRPLVSGALRLYGRTPASILRMTPRGWGLAWHECGRVRIETPSERHSIVCFDDLPPPITGSDGILESFLSNCDAALAYVKCQGRVTPHREALPAGKLTIDVSWTAHDAPSGPGSV